MGTWVVPADASWNVKTQIEIETETKGKKRERRCELDWV